uniref:Protein kinase domain-containing protein n=1 Tax=Fagus sylvatica TaxID=28930 RepID=A0A2N9GNV6_FAGSY
MQSSYKLYVLLFSVSIFFNYLTISITGKSNSTYSPIVLNCGSSGNSTDPDGRDWTGDVDVASKLVTLQQSNNTFIVSNSQASSVDHVPYNTARIFDSQFTYTFHDQKQVNITFTPSKNTSYAFINGIEIVSMPTSLYYSQSQIQNNTALEMVGSPIKRRWELHFTNKGLRHDVSEIGNGIPAYTAPEQVYQTAPDYNIEQTIQPYLEIARGHWVHIPGVRPPLSFIELRPNANSSAGHSPAILNGLELFKLNKPEVNPPTTQKPSAPKPEKYSKATKSVLFLASTIGVVTFFFLLGITIFCQRMRAKPIKTKIPPILIEGLCRRFSLQELRTAANNFDRNLIIGKGGSCTVYKGYIDDKHTPVAIKIIGKTSSQGFHEFKTEIEMLSKLRHPHLVSLIGYCSDERVMIIVYDFMPHGALRDHLYNTDNPPLCWKQRLEICIGAARGLLYLHEGDKHAIIHRDVKTNNILLDENWASKVSDFGLSRLGPTRLSRSHVTTDVKGTFGYLDPEYYWTSHLTVKSDVYGFGVVLFEVLCAREAVDMGLDDEQQSLAPWARQCFEDSTLDQIIDPNLIGQIAPECLEIYTNIAYRCLSEDRNQRPTMVEVLGALEYAMELQEIADAGAHAIIINEEVPLSVGGNLVVSRPPINGDLVHSCPTIWKKSSSHKELLRFLSERVGLKWVKSPKLGCCFATPEYNRLPTVHVQLPNLNSCGPYTTPGKFLIEIMKGEAP